jgi:hypothetical protein
MSRVLILLLLILTPLSGCSGQAHNVRLLKQWNVHCKEAADLLAGVKDVASAKASRQRIEELLKAMDEVQAQLDKSYDPENVDFADQSAVTEQAALGIVEMQRLVAESVRIAQNPELKAELGETWQRLSMGGLLDKPGMGQ